MGDVRGVLRVFAPFGKHVSVRVFELRHPGIWEYCWTRLRDGTPQPERLDPTPSEPSSAEET